MSLCAPSRRLSRDDIQVPRLGTRFHVVSIRLVNRFIGAHIRSRWKAILAVWLENPSRVLYESTERVYRSGSPALTHNPLSWQHILLQAFLQYFLSIYIYKFGLQASAGTLITFWGSTRHPKALFNPRRRISMPEHTNGWLSFPDKNCSNAFRKLERSKPAKRTR